MAGVIGLMNLLGQPSSDRLATRAERDVGTPGSRRSLGALSWSLFLKTTVIVVRADSHVTGRIGLATAANTKWEQVGTTEERFQVMCSGRRSEVIFLTQWAAAKAKAKPAPKAQSCSSRRPRELVPTQLLFYGGNVAGFDQSAQGFA